MKAAFEKCHLLLAITPPSFLERQFPMRECYCRCYEEAVGGLFGQFSCRDHQLSTYCVEAAYMRNDASRRRHHRVANEVIAEAALLRASTFLRNIAYFKSADYYRHFSFSN